MLAAAAIVLSSATAAAACLYDLRTRRIPNWLTFGSAGMAFLLHLFWNGFDGVLMAAGGWALGLAMFLPFFLLRGMGAGDVKLLAALGAWLGPTEVVWVALAGGLAGGVLALVVLVHAGALGRALSNIGSLFKHWVLAGLGPVPGLTLADAQSPRLPYAVPIAVGLVVTLWLR